jgi:hypothetical protein
VTVMAPDVIGMPQQFDPPFLEALHPPNSASKNPSDLESAGGRGGSRFASSRCILHPLTLWARLDDFFRLPHFIDDEETAE